MADPVTRLTPRTTPARRPARPGHRVLGLAGALLVCLGVAGCDNPCQQLCDELANYADECGYTVTPDQVSACKDDYAKSSLDEGVLQSCADHNDADALREWWTCDDVADNFSAAAP